MLRRRWPPYAGASVVFISAGLLAPCPARAQPDTTDPQSRVTAADPARPAEEVARSLPVDPRRAGAPLVRALAKLPLPFERNQGQSDPRVRFLARGSGYGLFLTPKEVVMVLAPSRARGESPEGSASGVTGVPFPRERGKSAVVRLRLV